jgi:hypothetical protein
VKFNNTLFKIKLAGTLVALFGSASNESNDLLQADIEPITSTKLTI